MKKNKLIALFLFSILATSAYGASELCSGLKKIGGLSDPSLSGDRLVELCETSYVQGFDRTKRLPYYSLYYVDKNVANHCSLEQPDFRPNPKLPVYEQATDAEYRNNPWDKGHLKPRASGDSTCSLELETVYYTNAAPQYWKMNRFGWAALEKDIRQFALRTQKNRLIVLTGIIYRSHKMISGTSLEIPDFFFKAVYAPELNETIGFMYRNQTLYKRDLKDGIYSIKQLEDKFGISIFNGLADQIKSSKGEILKEIVH